MPYSGDTIAKEKMENDMATNITQLGGMLTVREVSQLLHVHSNTLRRWSDQGIIKAYRIGPRGDRRFRAEDIAVLLLEENKGIRLDGNKEN
jgi:excisionase family DNA binding protein